MKISIMGSQTFQGKTALILFKDAGEAEDGPFWCFPFVTRAIHHYHDPIRAWGDAGYDYSVLFPHGKSSAMWAQDNTSGCNDYTWQKANFDLLAGLTAPQEADRKAALGDLFTTLGHLTHLVADMSVPEHTRNDSHIWSRTRVPLLGFEVGYRNYEYWCNNNLLNLSSRAMGMEAFRHAFPPDNAIFAADQAESVGVGLYSPVSNLWDSFVDNGYNPRLGQPGALWGLADYSNFNYLSRDTVFRTYAHPSREEVFGFRLEQVPAPDGRVDEVVYFQRYASDNVLVAHLAAADLLYPEWSQLPPEQQTQVPSHLDDLCYEDYASNLVARAVSYGTALVDYFFRGKFGVTVSGTTLTVENLSTGLDNGEITIYRDDAAGVRAPVPGFVDLPLILTPHETKVLTGFSPNPPSFDNRYTMVFRGTMENHGPGGSIPDSLVAGKVFSWPASPGPIPSIIDVGDNPHGLALTPDGGKLYVTNMSDGTVSVVDTATRQVVKTVQVGAGPVDVAVTPDGSKAFVSNEGGRSVSVIDTGSDNVVATITDLPPWPEEIAVDGQFAYLAHWSYTALSKIDTSNYSVSTSASPMRPCQGIALHPEENTVYLTYYTFYWGNAVAAVDRSNGGLLATIPGPDLNWSAAVAGSNRNLYVANPQINKVSIYNTGTNQAIDQLAVGGSPRGVAAGPGGAKVYVANLYDDTVSVIDTASNTVIGTPIPAGDGANDVAVSPDGGTLYVSNAFADTVSVIPLGADGLPASPPAPLAATASAAGEVPLAAAVLTGFPAGGRVTVDGEFPRYEEFVDGGYRVWFPAGSRILRLAFPGYFDTTIPVSVGPGETVTVDGRMIPE
ncbi:MAG: hypothetical protein Kow00128_21120 [Deltaproteobacteria bacterium]